MPPRKELHYFDQLCRARRFGPPRNEDERDLRFVEAMQRLGDKPFMDLEGYGRLFELKGALISGDITPAYSALNEEIIAQIMKRFPKLKVIFLARDPVERALSQLSMHVQLKLSHPFDVTDVEEVIWRLLRPGVLLRSHPSKIVARWRRHVPPEQFRIYFFEELERTPAALFRSIVCFLGGDPRRTRARLNRKEKVNSTGKLPIPESSPIPSRAFLQARAEGLCCGTRRACYRMARAIRSLRGHVFLQHFRGPSRSHRQF